MIKLEKVSMGYLSGQEVLKDISLTLEPGSFHFISGESGAGKSSLLSLLALSHKPSRGKMTMFDKNIGSLDRVGLAKMRGRIGTVFQDYRLLDHLTVEENVGLPLKVAGESPTQIAQKVKELLSWVGLGVYHKAKPEILSGGQKQRVAIARAVITKPDLLIADEPTGNLDASLALKFMYLFEALNKTGTTILFATHDENLISLFQYPVVRLKEGRIISQHERLAPAA
jgi:cell division transport system ATP-binding protein